MENDNKLLNSVLLSIIIGMLASFFSPLLTKFLGWSEHPNLIKGFGITLICCGGVLLAIIRIKDSADRHQGNNENNLNQNS